MAIAAVPDYLGKNYVSASPGDRFTMFLPLWGQNRRSGERLWTTQDLAYEVRGQNRQEREVPHENKTSAIQAALPLNKDDQLRMAAVAAREQALHSADTLTLPAISTSPFATGLGIEHPLENGFAFLNPYGLPYLPGSSIKGVLRKAAEELAQGLFGGTQGWTPDIITALFGLESGDHDHKHQRGTLCFWDVIPQIKGNRLAVEIMTPHQSHYLQGSASPHDSGSPNPISFLAVPAGSTFRFHVDCDLRRLKQLAPELVADQAQDDPWRALIVDAFEHAFQWLGFGAKTAVGYGAMQVDPAERKKAQQKAEAEREARRLADAAAARLAEEQRQREQQAAEALRRQQAFDALSPTQQLLLSAQRAVDATAAPPAPVTDMQRQAVLVAIKPLRELAMGWVNPAERESAAALLEQAFELIGWFEPGTDKKKRDKQTLKKRDLIADIRKGQP